jgi:chitin synthase
MTSPGERQGNAALFFLCPLLIGTHRKVAGEGKGEGHGEGGAAVHGGAVPLRRWEDWERSRLRKLRREERRRRDFERSHPTGYIAGDADLLGVSNPFDTRVFSQYDGSDSVSLASSEDDQWGGQIGGYNEHNAQYPPPPMALLPAEERLLGAETVDGRELEAMLETGFDDGPDTLEGPRSPRAGAPNRYQLSDSSSNAQRFGGNEYSPLSRTAGGQVYRDLQPNEMVSPTTPAFSSGVVNSGVGEWKTHAKKRSAGGLKEKYGPLGPLDPGTRF